MDTGDMDKHEKDSEKKQMISYRTLQDINQNN